MRARLLRRGGRGGWLGRRRLAHRRAVHVLSVCVFSGAPQIGYLLPISLIQILLHRVPSRAARAEQKRRAALERFSAEWKLRDGDDDDCH